jgi:hypothetical protein
MTLDTLFHSQIKQPKISEERKSDKESSEMACQFTNSLCINRHECQWPIPFKK